MQTSLLTILLVMLLASPYQQGKPVVSESIPTVSYCELVSNPNLYSGKTIRVKATWKYGFEISALYDRECMDRDNEAWVEMADDEQLCGIAKKNLKKLNKEFGKGDVMMVGKFYSGNRFGHERGYNYQFIATCLESVKQIPFDVP